MLSVKWNENSVLSAAVTLLLTVLVELQTSKISELKENLKVSPARCQLKRARQNNCEILSVNSLSMFSKLFESSLTPNGVTRTAYGNF